jgi:hypothetical protein
MTNPFYNPSGYPATRAPGASLNARAEFLLIQAGFDKLPTLAGNGLKLLRVNAGGTAIETLDPATYMTAAQVAATYLPTATAAATYATIASLGAYLTSATAAATYLALAGGTMTGPILGAVGAVGAPGYSFAGDTNTGMYRFGADELAFATGGVIRGGFDSVGRMGVGTATPSDIVPTGTNRLVVQGAGITTITAFDNGGGNNRIGMFADSTNFLVGWDTSYSATFNGYVWRQVGTERMRLDNSGRLLVATTTVGIGSSGFAYATLGGGDVSAFLSIKNNTPVEFLAGADAGNGTIVGSFTNHKLTFRTNNTARMEITAAGVIQDAAGLELGYRDVPRVDIAGGTIAVTERGKCYLANAGVTVPASTFPTGAAVSIYNDSAGAITITQGVGLTMRQGGTTNTGNRTLARYGMATVWFINATECTINGSGLT